MKFPGKILCIALLAFLAVPLSAQGLVGQTGASGLTQSTGSLSVSETVEGWTVQFSGMGASRPVVLAIGLSAGKSRLDVTPYGTLLLDVSSVFFVVSVGTTSSSGDLSVFIPRPATLPPRVDGSSVVLQGVSVDPSSLVAGHSPLFVKTNRAKITLTSASSYQ